METDKENLTLKEVVGYLPFGLKGHDKSKGVSSDKLLGIYGTDGHSLTLCFRVNNHNTVDYDCRLDNFIPHLRPLSDLTKSITHNGETFVPIEKLSEKCRMQHELFGLQNTIDLKALDYLKLLQWHFDIHGLIERNLAVNLNDLPNE